MTETVLHVFAISHYCEKACWALDHAGIEHRVTPTAPGLHVRVAEKVGAPGSSLPILVTNGQCIQGSSAIIDWVDDHTPPGRPRLTPSESSDESRAVERRLDDVFGVHVRRYYYSEALVEHPRTVRPIFTKDLPLFQKLTVGALWGRMRNIMIERMDLGTEQGRESREVVAAELDWLDQLLSDGRPFLVGESFSRADLTAASLLAPLAAPEQHPTYAALRLPPRLAAEIAPWEKRPVLDWVRKIYAEHR